MSQDLTSLVAKAQKGNENALNELIAQCYTDLYHFARKTIKNDQDAEDVTQEACMVIFQKLDTLKDPRAFRSWAHQIVYHRCTHHFRDNREVLLEENEDGETLFDTLADTDTSVMPEEVVQDKAFQQIMQDLINELPEQQRAAMMMYYSNKMSVREIAYVQSVSEGTVKSRLNYGRKALETKVTEYEKKHDVRLHSTALLPALLYFLFSLGKEESKKAGAIAAPGIAAATKGAAAGTAAAAGGAAANATGKGIGFKIGIAALILAGIGTAAIIGATVMDLPDDEDKKDRNNGGSSSVTQNDPKASEGLYFEYLEETNSYAVAGEGECTDTDIVIPSTYEGLPVTAIQDQAFYYSFSGSDITSVVIPDSVTSIGIDAFNNCKSLHSIVIPDSVTFIGENAFENCTSLSAVTLSSRLTIIPTGAFNGCTSLTTVPLPDGLKTIGDYAFLDCTALTSVTLPSTLTEIGRSAFSRCTALESVTIPDSVTTIGDSAFEKSGLISVSLPAGITSFGDTVFNQCHSLVNISIAYGATEIGENAFSNCSSLVSVTLPDTITTIGKAAFQNCTILASVNLPSGVTYIPESAFWGCKALTNFVIPEGITEIGTSAFYSCSNLASVSFPSSLTYIDYHAFGFCDNLQDFYFPGTIEAWRAVDRAFGSGTLPSKYTVHCSDGDYNWDLY